MEETEVTTEESGELEINSLEDLNKEIEREQTEANDVEAAEADVDIVAENDAKAAKESEETGEAPVDGAEAPADTLVASGDEKPAEEGSEAYTANFKYKYLDEEREMDPKIQAAIKSKEDEDYFRELVQKADGIELQREKMNKYRDSYEDLSGTVDTILDARDSGDMKSVMSSLKLTKNDAVAIMDGLGVTKEELIQHAYDLATLTEDQEVAYNSQRQLETQNRQLAYNNQRLNDSADRQRVESSQNELATALSRPEVADIVEEFDTKNGNNAFWDEVAKRGVAFHAVNGYDSTPQIMVQEVIERYGLKANSPTQAPPQSAAEIHQKQSELPVIPNPGAPTNKSAAQRKITSIKDIEREFEENYT